MEEMKLVKILWDYLCLGNPIEKCDCILGLGCYDLHIPEKCANLYKQSYSDTIIFSGGLGKSTESWNTSEAEKFSEIAIKLGVPKEKIYIENKSTNTGENFTFTLELIKNNNLSINSFLVVQKPYMERRCYAAFSALVHDKKCVITSPDISFEKYFKEYENGEISQNEIINQIVGDLQRIEIYPKNGWQIEQYIPEKVWDAYEKLVDLGYNKYII